ncbi:hypothetical protein BH23ACT7_BH23ACT7_05240 [soil metagenome]
MKAHVSASALTPSTSTTIASGFAFSTAAVVPTPWVSPESSGRIGRVVAGSMDTPMTFVPSNQYGWPGSIASNFASSAA